MNIIFLRKYLQIAVYYILPVFLLVLSVSLQNGDEFFEELGEPALKLLIFILFLTPIAQILDWKIFHILRALRREFGVASFWLFFFHAVGLIYTRRLTDIAEYLSPQSYLFWGAFGGIGMLILGVTSNDMSVKFFRKNWKRLQFVAVPTLFFSQAHASIADNESILPAVGLFLLYLVARFVGKYVQRTRRKKPRNT